MIEINRAIDLKPQLNLEIEVSMDGEVIIDREADSLIGNFLRLLHRQAGSNRPDNYYDNSADNRTTVADRIMPLSKDAWWRFGSNSPYEAAQIDTSVTPNKIDFDPTGGGTDIDVYGETNGLVSIWTKDADFMGFYCISEDSAGTDFNSTFLERGYLWEASIDPKTNKVTEGNAVDLSGSIGDFDGDLVVHNFRREKNFRSNSMFEDPHIIVGANPSAVSSAIEDQWVIADATPLLDQTGTSIGAPTVATNESSIEFSETFTNNAGFDISIGDIGLSAEGNRYQTLIARDATSFQIASGSTITITYKMTVSNSGDGGVMAQFNQILYRNLAQEFREAVSIFNTNESDDESGFNLLMAGAGGDNRVYYNNEMVGRNIGPQVGQSTTSVSNTDYGLLDRIPHGLEDGRLFYHGSTVGDFNIDESTGEAYFDVYRLFENMGSTSVGVDEVGLYGGGARDTDDYPRSTHLFARHTLSATQNIPAGEVLKLAYRIKLTE